MEFQIDANERTSLVKSSDEESRPNRFARSCGRRVKLWNVMSAILIVATAAFFLIYTGEHKSGFRTGSNLQDDVSDSLPHHHSTDSKYKKVQGIGFQIYTGGAPAFLNETGSGSSSSKDLNPECIGRSSYGQVVGEIAPELQCYIGQDDPMDDVRKRIEIMKHAVEKAYELADNDDSGTLKIFIAPEFYWRGVDGAYVFQQEEPEDDEICGPVCQILKGMEEIVAHKRFENWLFVFGTVIASDVLPTEDPYDYLFYNFSPVYKGYDPAKTDHIGKRFLLPKRYVSSSDFLTPQRFLNASALKELVGQELPEYDTTVFNPFDFNQKRYDNHVWGAYKNELNELGYTMIEYGWVMIDGLFMTLEVCFDHQMRTALNTYLGDMVTGRNTLIPSSSDNGLEYVHIPEYQAQISIVASAGMTVTVDSLALTNDGTIFLQDGLSNATNRMFWSVEGCELGLQFEGGTEAVQRRAFLSPTDVFFEHKALDTFKRHDLYHKETWEEALHGLFSTKVYPPQLTVFDPVDIALPRSVANYKATTTGPS